MNVDLTERAGEQLRRFFAQPEFVFPEQANSIQKDVRIAIADGVQLHVQVQRRPEKMFYIYSYLRVSHPSIATSLKTSNVETVRELGPEWKRLADDIEDVYHGRFEQTDSIPSTWQLSCDDESIVATASHLCKISPENIQPTDVQTVQISLNVNVDMEFPVPPGVDITDEEDVAEYFKSWWKQNPKDSYLDIVNRLGVKPRGLSVDSRSNCVMQ